MEEREAGAIPVRLSSHSWEALMDDADMMEAVVEPESVQDPILRDLIAAMKGRQWQPVGRGREIRFDASPESANLLFILLDSAAVALEPDVEDRPGPMRTRSAKDRFSNPRTTSDFLHRDATRIRKMLP